MTPLPHELGGSGLVAWRLDRDTYRATWETGEGAYRAGGRWNTKGVRAVYCAIDPATAILEVAVHKTFQSLDILPHVLTHISIIDTTDICIVQASQVPNPNWLRPGIPSVGQQQFGDSLLGNHKFVVMPSVVSTNSWNLMFLADKARGSYTVLGQEHFALDTRLNPP